jgi:uncharacterized membrane protein YfcA
LAVIGLVAFLASALTLYSGFGLGTILLAAFSIFFPVPVAVGATAVVHLLNNLLKGALLGRSADWRIVARFGLPAIPAAVAGAWLLTYLGGTSRLYEWSMGGAAYGPTGAGFTIGALMIGFAALELQPWFQRLSAPPRMMPVGGVVTGFVGGLTGQQGAFRSMFLMRCNLEPGRFIATGVLIAVLVDMSRIPIYAATIGKGGLEGADWRLIAFATLCAFAGAFIGARYLTKATIGIVRATVAGLMFVIGGALVAGLLGS